MNIGNIWPFSCRSLQWKALAAAPLPTRVWIPFKRGLSCTMGPNVGKFWHWVREKGRCLPHFASLVSRLISSFRMRERAWEWGYHSVALHWLRYLSVSLLSSLLSFMSGGALLDLWWEWMPTLITHLRINEHWLTLRTFLMGIVSTHGHMILQHRNWCHNLLKHSKPLVMKYSKDM